MNIKRFVIACIALFILFQLTGYLIHEVILKSAYESLANVWRPDMMDKMWIFYPMQVVLCFLFVYIFYKGYENKGPLEGLRFGVLIGLFMGIPASFSQYVLYPFPFILALQWFIYGMIEYMLGGLLVAAIYRPKKAA